MIIKNTVVRRVAAAILAAAAVALLLCSSGCSENVFSNYQSNTFELGNQW